MERMRRNQWGSGRAQLDAPRVQWREHWRPDGTLRNARSQRRENRLGPSRRTRHRIQPISVRRWARHHSFRDSRRPGGVFNAAGLLRWNAGSRRELPSAGSHCAGRHTRTGSIVTYTLDRSRAASRSSSHVPSHLKLPLICPLGDLQTYVATLDTRSVARQIEQHESRASL